LAVLSLLYMRNFVPLLLSLVLLTSIAGCTEEAQQNAQKTSDDTRGQMSGKVNFLDVLVENNSVVSGGNNSSDDETVVDSILVMAQIASGSQELHLAEIQYRLICAGEGLTVTLSDASEFEGPEGSGNVNVTYLSAGDRFQFVIQLEKCPVTTGDRLELAFNVLGGGETMVELEVGGTEIGRSMV